MKRDRSEAFKKLTIQTRKSLTKKGKRFSEDERKEMVQGILDGSVVKEDVVARSELPKEMLGVKVDWKEAKVKEKKQRKSKKEETAEKE